MPITGVGIGVAFRRVSQGGLDPNAAAFIAAAGITNPTEILAINQLVVDLKAYSIWGYFNAIYPFVGGTSTSNSYNLVTTDSFQITWYGGVTHNTNGVTFNGINGYGDTGYDESIWETFGDTTRAVYDRSNTNDFGCQIGAQGAGGGYQQHYMADNYNTNYYMDCYDVQDGYGRLTGSTVDSRAFWVSSRTSLSAGGYSLYKNDTSIGTTTNANVGSQPNVNTWIGGLNANGSLSQSTSHNLALVSMGNGLDAIQAGNYYTAVQTFQTTLGRAV